MLNAATTPSRWFKSSRCTCRSLSQRCRFVSSPNFCLLLALVCNCNNHSRPLNVSTRALKECDFEGRRRWQSKSTTAPVAASGFIADSEDFVVLGGLEGSVQTLRSLTATVHFQVDAVHRVEKAMGPIQASDHFHAMHKSFVRRASVSCYLPAFHAISEFV